jgi:STE24 endopeptidase
MSVFDPKAATDAFLAVLPAAGHLKAIRYTQGGHWLLLWGWLAVVVICLVIARLGLLPRLRRAIEAKRPRPRLFAFLAALVFLIAEAVLELPWDAYSDWWRNTIYGLTSQPFAGWLSDSLLNMAITAFALALFFMALYALMRRAGQAWWLWSGAVAAVFITIGLVLAPVFIEPLFNTYTPAPPGPTRDAVVALAEVAGVPSDKIYIYNGSKQSNRYTANVSGLFGSARVAMSDVMFAKGADIAEVRGVVGHEMGHYKRGHVFFGVAFNALLDLAGFGLTAALFPLVDRWVKTGAASIADPVGLPTLWIVLSTVFFLATPLTNTATRLQEADADAFSLRVAHEPSGLAKGLVKTIEYRADSPSALEEFLFYDHPSVRRRVQSAMDWKAAHLDEALAQEAADAAAGR